MQNYAEDSTLVKTKVAYAYRIPSKNFFLSLKNNNKYKFYKKNVRTTFLSQIFKSPYSAPRPI